MSNPKISKFRRSTLVRLEPDKINTTLNSLSEIDYSTADTIFDQSTYSSSVAFDESSDFANCDYESDDINGFYSSAVIVFIYKSQDMGDQVASRLFFDTCLKSKKENTPYIDTDTAYSNLVC